MSDPIPMGGQKYGHPSPLGQEAGKKLSNPKDAVGSKKPRWWSYIPLQVLVGVGLACLEGALKYGRHNYRKAGVRASVYFDAAVNGHLMRFWEGEDIDPDSGLDHIDKAIASLMILQDSRKNGNWVDDRPIKATNIAGVLEDAQVKMDALLARYPDPVAPFTEKPL